MEHRNELMIIEFVLQDVLKHFNANKIFKVANTWAYIRRTPDYFAYSFLTCNQLFHEAVISVETWQVDIYFKYNRQKAYKVDS